MLLWLLPFCLTAVWFGIAAFEWVRVGLIADPAALARYPFGSTEGLGDGTAHYASAQVYAAYSLKFASLSGVCTVLFAVAGAHGSRAILAAGYAVVMVAVGVASNAL